MKSLFVTLTLKRKLCFLLSVVLILTLFPVYAFADDPEESNSSGDSDVITDEMVDAELQSLANNLYQVQLLNDTRATTYTTTDIYNFMVNHFLMGGAQNGYMYQQYSTLLALNTKVQAIMTYANSIREYTELIHDSVTGDNTPITLYDLIGDHLGNISNMLGVTEGNTTLSAAELLLLINNTIDDSYLALGNIQTTLASIQNNIALLYAVMTDIAESNNDIVTQTTTMNANMQLMISRLQSMQNDFNNINWLPYSDLTNIIDSNGDTPTLPVRPTANSSYTFIYPNIGTINPKGSIFRIDLPIQQHYAYGTIKYPDISINVGTDNSKVGFSYSILDSFYQSTKYTILIYIPNMPSVSTYNIYVTLTFNTNAYRIYNSTGSISYIPFDSLDYYIVYDFLYKRHSSNILSKFELLYASDDLIAAKEDQQPYEDQAIQDFTGSGSAAAKGSDLTDMKSISGALKQGLSSGGSVSNALSPFNTNSGFWAWFSQSNYDDINNLSTPRLRAGNPNNELEIIDFYNDNQLTLHGLLSGGGY